MRAGRGRQAPARTRRPGGPSPGRLPSALGGGAPRAAGGGESPARLGPRAKSCRPGAEKPRETREPGVTAGGSRSTGKMASPTSLAPEGGASHPAEPAADSSGGCTGAGRGAGTPLSSPSPRARSSPPGAEADRRDGPWRTWPRRPAQDLSRNPLSSVTLHAHRNMHRNTHALLEKRFLQKQACNFCAHIHDTEQAQKTPTQTHPPRRAQRHTPSYHMTHCGAAARVRLWWAP